MDNNLPENINKILNNEFVEDETILFKNEDFILLIDPKNKKNSYHYTAWCRNNISSLKYITFNTYQAIIDLKKILIKKKIIKKNDISYIHYPPQFYRLHIHFVHKNHIYTAPKKHIFFLEDIKKIILSKL